MKAASAPAARPPWDAEADEHTASGAEKAERKRPTQATLLVELALANGAEPFHDAAGEAYLTITRDGHRETFPMRSRAARAWLAALQYRTTASAPSAAALADAIGTLEGRALFSGQSHEPAVRVAEAAGRLYLDLGRPDFSCVELTPSGWRVLAQPPAAVRFRRPRGLGALPLPERGGRLDELRQFLNLASDADFVLAVAFVVAALRPNVPAPILLLQAEQGAGKSTTARAIRSIVDANVNALRAAPTDIRDLAIAASHNLMLCFDNLSGVSAAMSDALCRLATGGAVGGRALYTDGDEFVLDARRPVILNSIEPLAVRGDLADRSLVVELPTLADGQRVAEREYWRTYAEAQPRILAGVLDAACAGLGGADAVMLDELPRMADFASFCIASEDSGQWPRGAFLQAYRTNRQRASEAVLDGDLVAAAVRQIGPFTGSAGELLERLGHAVPVKPRAWPQSPRVLSNALRRLAPALRRAGITVRFERYREGRLVVIESSAEATEMVDPAPAMHDEPAEDAADDEPAAPGLWPDD